MMESRRNVFCRRWRRTTSLTTQEATALQYEKTDYQLLIYEQLQSIYELLRKEKK